MKKKVDPQHYPTDALITSDEWDSFDYNLRLQIEELGHIDYDGKSTDWKKNTFAFGYLYHVEKLLDEKMLYGDHEFEDIRELRTRITKYDNLKTCLLTLRIATIAYRAGLIPEIITEGEAHFKYRNEQSKKGCKSRARNGMTPAEREVRNEKIIEHFKTTHLTPASFAEKHAAEYTLKPRTIRLILSKALGS